MIISISDRSLAMTYQLLKITVIISTAIILIMTILLNASSWTGFALGKDSIIPYNDGWFRSNILNNYEKHGLEILPAGWTFQIWIFVFAYQFLWISYSLSLIFRRTNDGFGYLFYHPDFMPLKLYLVFTVNMALDIGWLFTFDRELSVYSTIFMFGVAVSLYVCLAFSVNALQQHGIALFRIDHRLEVRLVRGLVQNGLATYSTWVTVNSVIDFGILLMTSFGVSSKDASTICLTLIGVELIALTVVDLTVLDRYTRYLMLPYFVRFFALAGIVHRVATVGGRNLVMAGIVLALTVIAFVAKGLTIIWRSQSDPEPLLRQKQQS
ncbi:hypothetical protein LSH36_1169g00008 [Paralvinella palmiformis]|uniref:Uncharacterized protein n=1 Tax=Paralvinella palmiformis TaxID=53620 RepID=A0AAD9IUG3_9ANNE|nr:hypothetical protein LSH36_1169g00008 [Paralvinella palmiformis]